MKSFLIHALLSGHLALSIGTTADLVTTKQGFNAGFAEGYFHSQKFNIIAGVVSGFSAGIELQSRFVLEKHGHSRAAAIERNIVGAVHIVAATYNYRLVHAKPLQ